MVIKVHAEQVPTTYPPGTCVLRYNRSVIKDPVI